MKLLDMINSHLKSIIFKYWWRIRWYAPNLIPMLGDRENEYRKMRESRENQESSPPLDLNLHTQAISAIELYGPTEIDELYKKLEKLDWSMEAYPDRLSPSNWIQRQRTYGIGTAVMNIGAVIRDKQKSKYIHIKNFAELPEEIDYLDVKIIQITPSLTALAIDFYLNEPFARTYDKELRKERKTFHVRKPKWKVSTESPIHQKTTSVETAREQLRKLAIRWIWENVPGMFCNLADPLAFPTMEVISSKGFSLLEFDSDGNARDEEWRRILAYTSRYDIWRYEEQPRLQFTFAESILKRSATHLIASIDTATIAPEDLKFYGGDNPESACRYALTRLEGVLLHLACASYANEQLKYFSLVKDRINADRHKIKTKSTIQQIKLFFESTLGTRAISKELHDISSKSHYLTSSLNGFICEKWNDEKTRKLSKEAREHMEFLSKRVMTEDSSLRSHLEQMATIFSAAESIAAQRRMEKLTIIALLVAAGSLWAALPDLTNIAERILQAATFLK